MMFSVSDRPVILLLDSDREALARTGDELRGRYDRDYRVLVEPSPAGGVARLEALRAEGVEVTVVCERAAPRSHEIRNLLARSGVPHAVLAADSPEGSALLEEMGRPGVTHPVVVVRDGTVLDDPSDTELARHGYRVPTELEKLEFDVAIV